MVPEVTMPSAAQPIGVGIVGLSASGGWAARAHVPALRALHGYALRALSASSPASAEAAGREHGVPLTFASADELARSPGVDLVVVAVKVPDHHALVSAAIDTGKAVLCEWPLAAELSDAEDLARRANAMGVATAVGLQARSAPAIRFLRDIIADGYVGRVLSSSMVASGRAWGAEVASAAGRYLVDRANGATLLSIPVGHALDGAAFVLGEPTAVTATLATRRTVVADLESGGPVAMTAPDQVAVTTTLAGGVVMTLHFRGGLTRGANFRWEINGTEGDLVVTGPDGHLQHGRITIHGARDGDIAPAPLAVPPAYRRVPWIDGGGDAVAHAYLRLEEDLRTGTALVPDFAHAVVRHRTLAAIEEAAAAEPVRLTAF